MKEKEKIQNSFFELIAFLVSMIFNFFRSIKALFTIKKVKKNIFFDFLDFVFRSWPKYFWSKPTFYKLGSFVGDIFSKIFKK